MSTPLEGPYQAPIGYVDVRASYNVVRAVGAFIIVVASIVATTWGLATAPLVLAASSIVVIDALYRIKHGTSAAPVLLIDATLIGSAFVIRGDSPSIEVGALVYVLTAAMLLLPLRQAGMIVLYAVSWGAPIALFAPLITEIGRTRTQEVILDRLAAGIFVGLVALLLYAASRVLRDAAETHREALESHRRAVRLKNEFVSMVSHELRTPLTSITGFTDTLREVWRDLNADEVEEFLGIMRREEAHLSNLVEDILVIPRLEAGQLKLIDAELDLRHEAYETAKLVFHEGTKEFNVAIPGGVMVIADPIRLKQILRNLLENARKYGGDQVLVEGEQRGELYQVVVADNGTGISEADRARIFEHFEQLTKGDSRSDQGVGLGLPIARKLARAMGGDLWFEPRFPTGSRFCFTIGLGRITAPTPIRANPTETGQMSATGAAAHPAGD